MLPEPHSLAEVRPPTSSTRTEAIARDVRQLISHLSQLLEDELPSDTPTEAAQWLDDEYVYLELKGIDTRILALDLNVQDGNAFIRIER